MAQGADAGAIRDPAPPGDRAAVHRCLRPQPRGRALQVRGLPRHYDAVGAVMSFGQDPRWRRAVVDAAAPAAGERVLDVATGTGMVAARLRARADCRVVGLDQSDEMLAGARERFAGDRAV